MSAEVEGTIVDVVTDSKVLITNLVTEPGARLTEYRVRNSAFNKKSVHIADVADWEARGWEVTRPGKRQSQIKQEKPLHKRLEDRAWCLLYKMGYAHLGGERFVIQFKRGNGSDGKKQIDAFAYDDETAIVIECKSKEERGKKSL